MTEKKDVGNCVECKRRDEKNFCEAWKQWVPNEGFCFRYQSEKEKYTFDKI